MIPTLRSRPPSGTDAILGLAPARVFEPRSLEELAEIVRATAADGLALAPIGAGSQLDFGNPLARYDAAVRMRGLDRVVEYTPEDQVVVVESGMTLGALQAVLAKHGQCLAVDPLHGEGKTIGGLLATNSYGPSSMRYGTLKDLIVGIEIVRADGAVAHGGGKVVKNVAGFDLSKVMVGSLGTLGIVSKATFRVHPLPEKRRSIRFGTPSANVFPFVRALREAQLEPAALVAKLDVRETAVEVRFEGFSAGVDAQVDAALQVIAPLDEGPVVDAPHLPSVDDDGFALTATFRPEAFARVAAEFETEAAAWGFGTYALPAAGALRFGSSFERLADPPFEPAVLIAMREIFEGLGGRLVVRRMPRIWYGEIDVWGTAPPSLGLMAALKDRFDPTRRLNPGRFIGGL